MKIVNFDVCRHPQRFYQRYEYVFLSLIWSGLKFLDGFHCSLESGRKYLTLSFPGESVDFEFGQDRENWVAIFDSPNFVRDPESGQACWLQDGHRVMFPATVELTTEQASVWRDEFTRLREIYRNPTPANLLRVEWGVTGMLRFMLDQKGDTPSRSPV